ncbi:hypothetical protein V5740_10245 [Croceibacterium sp. TMG7-5b_MA50]|uniref:hypothetical protein n=1 Tax=Croceibacterium sp. TMG7-5b_MA50 TaxID=3121290 RepID=UPI003221D4B1
MIDSAWLKTILRMTGNNADTATTNRLAEQLCEPEEVLPHLVSAGKFKDWPATTRALGEARTSVVHPTHMRGDDRVVGWQDSERRPRLVRDLHSLMVSRDVAWRPEWAARGPHVGDVVEEIAHHRRFANSKAAPSTFIYVAGYAEQFRPPTHTHQIFNDGSNAPTEAGLARSKHTGRRSPPATPTELAAAIGMRILAQKLRWRVIWALSSLNRRRLIVRRMLQQDGIFNGDDYLARHPDVAQAGMDPVEHFLNHGAMEGRMP